jgi:hypothetical protein
MDEKSILERLDKIISLLEVANKQPSVLVRIGNGVATGAGILGLISIIDIIKTWLGDNIMAMQIILTVALLITSALLFYVTSKLKHRQ